jgi:S1-C subfamily serine protease
MILSDWQTLGIDLTSGVYVNSVEPGGPADTAGVVGGSERTEYQGLYTGGDVIVAIDGMQVLTYSDLLSYLMSKKSPGEEVLLRVYRDGDYLEIPVTLGVRP